VAERRTVLAFATQGAGSNDEARILELLADHDVQRYAFDRAHKLANVRRLLQMTRRVRPALIVMEGTGAAGALAVLMARALLGTPYVVSSGDAVGPFIAGARPRLAVPAWGYEWLLYRAAAGFIGWTPYLVGRALTMGAPRGVSAPGFTPHPEAQLSREEVRDRLGVPRDAVVFGIVGGLDYNERKGYCYGLELVRALRRVDREGLAVVVIGGGSGLDRLRELAGEELGRRAFIPGPVPRRLVTSYLAGMDVGSLPQSLDQVGAVRYTTKISEYATARLPIVTGRLPVAYDLAEGWSWRLPGPAPWSEEYVDALAALMGSVTRQDIDARRAAMPPAMAEFDGRAQRRRVGAFVSDLLDDTAGDRRGRAGRRSPPGQRPR
jgi:hypothetical protein